MVWRGLWISKGKSNNLYTKTSVRMIALITNKSKKKNPTDGRHRISRPMRIVAPILLFSLALLKGLTTFFIEFFVFVFCTPSPLSFCFRCRRKRTFQTKKEEEKKIFFCSWDQGPVRFGDFQGMHPMETYKYLDITTHDGIPVKTQITFKKLSFKNWKTLYL